ncbi:DNA and RNA helicase [Brevibacillus sp. SYSU BS000544]|uniref:DNA and RNA helicase n=1 Tax=Brevibacillus sp. SYSU BS000544 TaxID=3416443 RepID=UPI003CE4BDC1
MFSNHFPHFLKGRILKKEMLENLRDYPRDFTEILFQDFSDGIITGADVLVGDDSLTITKGIVKHQGRIYILANECQLCYTNSGKETLLKIRFKEEQSTSDYTYYETEIALDERVQIHTNEMELARFKLKEGAQLRSQYQSFGDLATEFNTLQLIHVEYAGYERSTLHPAILRYFATEALQAGASHPYDISFAMQCMQQGTVDRQLILYYVSNRLGSGFKDYSNLQIHKYLGIILDEIRTGSRVRRDLPGGRQRVIVD